MSAILSTKERATYQLAAGQVFVTHKSKAPTGVTQQYEGEFSKHVIAEKFDSATLRQIAIHEIWPIVEDLVFHQTRAALLKEFITKNKNAKEIPGFALSLNNVIRALRSDAEQKVGKLSEALITQWAKESGLEDALMDRRMQALGESYTDEQLALEARKVQGAIAHIAALSGAAYKNKIDALDMCTKLLSYAPEHAMKDRLLERVETLKQVEKAQDFSENDF